MTLKKVNPKKAKITLLTKEQADELPLEIRRKGCWWWLRSPRYSDDAAGVYYDGWANSYGNVDYTGGGVVPAFIIENLDAKFGDKVHVGRLRCTVVGDNLVLSDEVVCQHRYDAESSNWENSELKAFIESDEFAKKYVLECEDSSAVSVDEATEAPQDTEKLMMDVIWLLRKQDKAIEELQGSMSNIAESVCDYINGLKENAE